MHQENLGRHRLSAFAVLTALLFAAPAHAQWLYRPAMPGPWSAQPSSDQLLDDGVYVEDPFELIHPEDPYFGLSIRRHRGAGNGYNFGYGDSVRRYHGLNYSSPYFGTPGRVLRSHHGFHRGDRFHYGHRGSRFRHGLGGGHRFHGRQNATR